MSVIIPTGVTGEYLKSYDVIVTKETVTTSEREKFQVNNLKCGIDYDRVPLYPLNNNKHNRFNYDLSLNQTSNNIDYELYANLPGSINKFDDKYVRTIFNRNLGYNKVPLSFALKLHSLSVKTDNVKPVDVETPSLGISFNNQYLNGRDKKHYDNKTDHYLGAGFTYKTKLFYQKMVGDIGDDTDFWVNKMKVFPVAKMGPYDMRLDGIYFLSNIRKQFLVSDDIYASIIKKLSNLYIDATFPNTQKNNEVLSLFILINKLKLDYIQGNLDIDRFKAECVKFDATKDVDNVPSIVVFVCNTLCSGSSNYKLKTQSLFGSNNQNIFDGGVIKDNIVNLFDGKPTIFTDSFLFFQNIWGYEKERSYGGKIFDNNLDTFADFGLLPSLGGLKSLRTFIDLPEAALPNDPTNRGDINTKLSEKINRYNSNLLWFTTISDEQILQPGFDPNMYSMGRYLPVLDNGSCDIKINNVKEIDIKSIHPKIIKIFSDPNIFNDTLNGERLLKLISSFGYDNIQDSISFKGLNLTKDDILALLAGYNHNYYSFAKNTQIGGLINILISNAQYDRYLNVIDEYQSQYITIKNDEFLPLNDSFYEFGVNPYLFLNENIDVFKIREGVRSLASGEANLFRLLLDDSDTGLKLEDYGIVSETDKEIYKNVFKDKVSTAYNNYRVNDGLYSYYLKKIKDIVQVSGLDGDPTELTNIMTNNRQFFNIALKRISDNVDKYLDSGSSDFLLGGNKKDSLDELKSGTYYNLKSIHDNYISFGNNQNLVDYKLDDDKPISTNINNILNNDLFYSFDLNFDCKPIANTKNTKKINHLYDYVKVLDNSNNDVGHTMFVDMVHLKNLLNLKVNGVINTEYVTKNTIYGTLDSIANNNRFIMHSICSYANLNGAIGKNENAVDFANKMFGTNTTLQKIDNAPALIFQLASLTSTVDKGGLTGSNVRNPLGSFCLDIDPDGSKIKSTILPKTYGESLVSAFVVDFANQNQNMFANMNLSTSEFANTEESIRAYTNMVSNTNETKNIISNNNLFNMIENRSYTCQVESMGNAMIQPLSYFYLKNVPIFNGAYWITNVVHTLSPNTMKTIFKGVRQPIVSNNNNKSAVIRYLADTLDKIIPKNKAINGEVNGLDVNTSGDIFHNRYKQDGNSNFGLWIQRTTNGDYIGFDGLDVIYSYLMRETNGEPHYVLELSKIYNQASILARSDKNVETGVAKNIKYIVDIITKDNPSLSELTRKYPINTSSEVYIKLNTLNGIIDTKLPTGFFNPDKPLKVESGNFTSNGIKPSVPTTVSAIIKTDINSVSSNAYDLIVDSVDIKSPNIVTMSDTTNLGVSNFDYLNPFDFKIDSSSNKVGKLIDNKSIKQIGIYGETKKKIYITADNLISFESILIKLKDQFMGELKKLKINTIGAVKLTKAELDQIYQNYGLEDTVLLNSINSNINKVDAEAPVISTQEFLAKVKEVAMNLEVHPNWLLLKMFSESGVQPNKAQFRLKDGDIKRLSNGKIRGGVGLIQFTDNDFVAEKLKSTKGDILKTDVLKQMDYVQKYYESVIASGGKIKSFEDLLISTVAPAYRKKGADTVLIAEDVNNKDYSKSKRLDTNNDGLITLGEHLEQNYKYYKDAGIDIEKLLK